MKARAALLAIVIGLALAGCGGDQTSSTDAPAATNAGQAATAPSTPAKPKEEAGNGPEGSAPAQGSPRSDSPAGKQKSTAPTPTGPAPTDPGPLPNEGSKAAAAGVPTTKGGDNSLQEYGVEAPSAERLEAAATAQAYFSAQLAGEWGRACSLLAPRLVDRLGLLSRQAQKRTGAEGCPPGMAALAAQVPRDALRKAAELDVLSFRVEGDQAFLIYTNGDEVLYSVPMEREDDVWKLASVAGHPLVP